MTIPTSIAFANLHGTGPNINRVTNELAEYWQAMGNNNQSINDRISAYQFLIATCQNWLKRKDGKSDFETKLLGGHTNYINQKFVGRRAAIATIAETATRELMAMLEQNGLLTADRRGQLSFDTKKFHEKRNRIAFRHGTKGLDNGYQQERQTWLSSGKVNAISGTKIHAYHTSGDITSARGTPYNQLKSHQRSAVQAILGDKGSTAKHWKIISELDRIGDIRVAFLRKSERYRYMAYINKGLFEDASAQPIDQDQVLWTMDRYGNMFIYNDASVRQHLGIDQVNHSSMNAGKEVICAGMITVANGQVTYITNTSGHYKPTPAHLAKSLALLIGEGLDLTQAAIMTVDFNNPPQAGAWWVSWRFDIFISSNGSAGEISRVAGPRP